MLKALRFILPLIVLGIAFLISYYFIASKPEPRQRNFPDRIPEVRVQELMRGPYDVQLESQGIVQARTQINLVGEVRGRILEIAPNFREGGFFEKGDVLVEIDPLDYESELVIAEASLAQAELNLAQEEARFEQAKIDWERLGVEEKPSALVLREPQINQARASVASAEARVEAAKRNLGRTQIRAPFAGRVLRKNADIGQFISPGNSLAVIYAVDFAEVRLPLSTRQLPFINLPEAYRGDDPVFRNGPRVIITAEVGNVNHTWRGRVVRSDGSIDQNSRQLFVIAQFPNPYGRTDDSKPPLKVGTFVQASIEGRTLQNVYSFPRKYLKETEYVIVVDKDQLIHRRKVNVAWSSPESIVVDDGFIEGDLLCLTDVPYTLEGLKVNVTGVEGSGIASTSNQGSEPQQRGGGGPGGFIQSMLNAIPADKEVPEAIQKQLDEAIASGDRQKIRPAMEALRNWASKEGIELPAGRGR